jgi:hypothetical protein
MKSTFAIVFALLAAACSPSDRDQNPRDRKGVEGALTWRAVTQADGDAAFLSRPSAAPDVVLWCRDGSKIVLRAHVFENPALTPDLRMTTAGGVIVFENVRRQGGVRAGDRTLVEGAAPLADPKVRAILAGAAQFDLQTGDDKYTVQDADPNSILPSFIASCSQTNAPTSSPKE